jgi:hypothetical protein
MRDHRAGAKTKPWGQAIIPQYGRTRDRGAQRYLVSGGRGPTRDGVVASVIVAFSENGRMCCVYEIPGSTRTYTLAQSLR